MNRRCMISNALTALFVVLMSSSFLPPSPVVDSEGPGSETRLDRPVSAKGTRGRHPPPPSSSSAAVTTEGESRASGELHVIETSLKRNFLYNYGERFIHLRVTPGQDDVIAESQDSHMTANQSPSPPPPPSGLA